METMECLFQCNRVLCSSEPSGEKQPKLHALLELTTGLLCKNVDSRIRTKVKERQLCVVPLKSCGAGWKFIFGSDQTPELFHFSKERSKRLNELMRLRKSYSHLDIPETSKVTRGYETTTSEENEQISTIALKEGRRKIVRQTNLRSTLRVRVTSSNC